MAGLADNTRALALADENAKPEYEPYEGDPYVIRGVKGPEWAEEGLKYGWRLFTLDDLRARFVDRTKKTVKPVDLWIFVGKPWHVLPGRQKPHRFQWLPSGHAICKDPFQISSEWLFGDDQPPERGLALLGMAKDVCDEADWQFWRHMKVDRDGIFRMGRIEGAFHWTWTFDN